MNTNIALNGIDLNLLPKFRALYRYRSVSKAAADLHLTQSALSNALAKMRSVFSDDLFIRTSDGMEPTALAHDLAEPIDRALARLENGFHHVNGFDPSKSTRTFRLAMTQLSEAWIVPKLLASLGTTAPGVVLSSVPAGTRTLGDDLRDGAVDFAVGHFPEFGPGFKEIELGLHEIVCIVRSGHPMLEGTLTPDALLQSDFVEVVEHGALYAELSRAVKRVARIDATRYKTSNALALPYVVAKSDLVAIVPAWFAEQHAKELALTIVKMPAEMSVANFKLLWHSNRDEDASHAFMRTMITEAAAALNGEKRANVAVEPLVVFTGEAA